MLDIILDEFQRILSVHFMKFNLIRAHFVKISKINTKMIERNLINFRINGVFLSHINFDLHQIFIN